MASPILHPARGLLHPAWLVSLAVLALNDHVLKGSGLLPAPLTGKLSDVAGMLVAPLLLAVLLRVRSWRGWVACHVAVGAVFSAIQLSAACADGWSALMGLCGFPWVITRDATDLYTLPALALGLWGLAPALRRPATTSARRSAELGVATVGLVCCAATSRPDPCCDDPTGWDDDFEGDTDDGELEPPGLPSFSADVYVHNATAQSLVVRLRELRPEVMLDCDTVARDPGALLRSALFNPATSWTLPANANVAVVEHPEGAQPCYAAWVEADALPSAVMFWYDGAPPIITVPGEGQAGHAGEVALVPNGLEGLRLEPVSDLVFPAQAIEPAGEGECAAQPDGLRVGWSSPVPWGLGRIDAIDVGPDGCFALDLTQGEQLAQTWYLCVPESSFPFAVGDEIDLRVPEGVDPELDAIELVTRGEDGEPTLPSLLASAGGTLPIASGVELLAVPLFTCDVASEPRCGTVERPMALLASGPDFEAIELRPGEGPRRLGGDGRALELTVMHAQERFVLDPACGLGPDALGPDLEVVIAQWPRGI